MSGSHALESGQLALETLLVMDSFRWDSCFVTGLHGVDEQHRKLVDLINRFGTLVMQAHGTTAHDMERVFGELADYAEFHFRDEEEMMARRQIDPRFFELHRHEHATFLRDLAQMHTGMSNGAGDEASSMLRFLTNWLAYHILGTDQVMARLMTAVATGEPVQEAYLAAQKIRDPATATLLHALNALNALFHQVSDRNRALLDLNQTLEARVAERTGELSDANQRLENMAMTDVLTGLPNRRFALHALEREWRKSTQLGTPLACMLVDADGFKGVNDSHGHDAGDDVLRALARQLTHAVRNDDVACRLGGDEFLIVCCDTPVQGTLLVAGKVLQEVASLSVPTGNGAWQGSVSIGVAQRDASMKGVEGLLKAADEGLYEAKRRGRNCAATV